MHEREERSERSLRHDPNKSLVTENKKRLDISKGKRDIINEQRSVNLSNYGGTVISRRDKQLYSAKNSVKAHSTV